MELESPATRMEIKPRKRKFSVKSIVVLADNPGYSCTGLDEELQVGDSDDAVTPVSL
jgi:hypothetical protein